MFIAHYSLALALKRVVIYLRGTRATTFTWIGADGLTLAVAPLTV